MVNNVPPPKVSKLKQRISYVVMNVASFYYSEAAGMAPRLEAAPLGRLHGFLKVRQREAKADCERYLPHHKAVNTTVDRWCVKVNCSSQWTNRTDRPATLGALLPGLPTAPIVQRSRRFQPALRSRS